MIEALIIDDESKSRRILNTLLNQYCPDVNVVGSAENVLEGIALAKSLKPSLIFLDIEMPKQSGFDFVDAFEDLEFELVFTTAYEQYAIRAFQAAATGYLLKPIVIEDLVRIVDLVKSYILPPVHANSFGIITSKQTAKRKKKIVLPIQYGTTYINLEDVCFFEAEGRKVKVCMIDGSQDLIIFNLKKCLELVKEEAFIRIHKSYGINIRKIDKYIKGKDSHVILECGSRVDVGLNYKHDFLEALSFFPK